VATAVPVPLDQWSPLNHKAPLDPTKSGPVAYARSWAPDDTDERRLAAYYVLELYRSNNARAMLPTDGRDPAAHREYGDAGLLVQRLVAAVLGADWTIVVDSAGDDLTEGPRLPEMPTNPGEGADALVQRLYAARLQAWHQDVEKALAAYEDAVAAQPAARAREAALRAWSDRRGFPGRAVEAETDAVALGDAVYVLWPQAGDWPLVSVVGPDAFFPLLTDDDAGEFTDRLDLAWEFVEDDANGNAESYLRRHTWEIVEIAATRSRDDGDGGATWVDEEGNPTERPVLYGGEGSPIRERVRDGRIERRLPWHGKDAAGRDEYTTVTCIYTSAVWALRNLDGRKLRDLDERKAESITPALDLLADFIPVIHEPNTPSSSATYGVSSISPVAQVLDDVATNDVDAMTASRYLSDPVIFLTGVHGEIPDVVAPGRMWKGGETGRMDVLDLSVGLEKLTASGDRLQARYWQNAGVPGEMLGRVDANEVSGVALALRLAPFAQLVATMRTARDPKYRLLLKFVQRLAQIAQVLDPGPTAPARLAFGNFLPTSQAETVEMVSTALTAKAISTETAVALLIAAGFPVADAAAEVDRIRVTDGATAKDIADATGSEQVAAEYLGVELPGQAVAEAAPVLDLPPTGT
jgi:hypothetical protein